MNDMRLRAAWLRLSLLFLLAAAGAADNPADQRSIEWKAVESASAYQVEIRNSAQEIVLDKKVEAPKLTFSLPPGDYEVRITVLNKFEKPSAMSPWSKLSVRKSVQPEPASVGNEVLYAGLAGQSLSVQGKNFLPQTELYLEGGGKSAKGKILEQSSGRLVAAFDLGGYPPGAYKLRIRNPPTADADKALDVAVKERVQPVVASVSPSSFENDRVHKGIIVEGSGFQSGLVAEFVSPSGAAAKAQALVLSPKTASLTWNAGELEPGAWRLVITNPGGLKAEGSAPVALKAPSAGSAPSASPGAGTGTEPRTVVVEKIVEVPVEKIVEKRVEVPVDRIVEKIVEVPVDRVVEKIVEVPVDRVVEVPAKGAGEAPPPQVVEKIVEVPVDRVVEKIVEVPVDRIVEKRVEVPVDRVVEKIVEVPVDRVVEKRVEVPVDRVVEKIVEVPVDRIVEKRVEVPVDRVVEKIVEVPVDRIVEKQVEVPVDRVVEVPRDVVREKVVVREIPFTVAEPRTVSVPKGGSGGLSVLAGYPVVVGLGDFSALFDASFAGAALAAQADIGNGILQSIPVLNLLAFEVGAVYGEFSGRPAVVLPYLRNLQVGASVLLRSRFPIPVQASARVGLGTMMSWLDTTTPFAAQAARAFSQDFFASLGASAFLELKSGYTVELLFEYSPLFFASDTFSALRLTLRTGWRFN